MSTYLFSAISNGGSVAFNPAADLLSFDDLQFSAADVTVTTLPDGSGSVWVTPTKTFTLIGAPLADVNAGNTQFVDGSLLVNASRANPLTDSWNGSSHDDLLISTPALPMTLASVSPSGVRAVAANQGSLSSDGRYMAFSSTSPDLVTPGEPATDQDSDIFVKDLVTGEITRASYPGVGGAAPAGGSILASISADGRHVVFQSTASNLVDNDTNGVADLFVKDLQTGSIVRASTSSTGEQANGASVLLNSSISADGRWVAFQSSASNLVAGDTNGASDVFVKDLQTGALIRGSTSSAGAQGNAGLFGSGSAAPTISSDGKFLLFRSNSSNLVAGDNNDSPDFFLKNLTTGTLSAVSVNSSGAFVDAFVSSADLSANGRYVVFTSSGHLLNDGQDGSGSIYLRDMQTGTLQRIKGVAAGTEPSPQGVAISDDGRFVVFNTVTPMTADDHDVGGYDVFVKDMQTGTVALVSSFAVGTSPESVSIPAISGDGHIISFASTSGTYAVANPLDIRILAGGAGDDHYVISQSRDQVVEEAGQGNDTVTSSASFELPDNVENLTLDGLAAINATGNALGNRIAGNSAANVLDGKAGNDTMTGGDGNDTYVADAAGDVVIETATGGVDTLRSTVSRTLMSYVENLTLEGSGAIDGTGNALGNIITGTAADNRLDGGSGLDTVSYANAAGAVTVDLSLTVAQATGGAGNDTLLNFENIIGSKQGDVLSGNAGSNRIDGGFGFDSMAGGAGNDTYVVNDINDRVTEVADGGVDLVESSVTWTLGVEVENLTLTTGSINSISGTGNALDNRLVGNSGYNTLVGAAGDDTLDGGAAIDRLEGGAGNDTYVVDNLSDSVIEQADAGQDLVQSSVNWTLATSVEDLLLTGTASINGIGNSLANRITGNAGNNILNGGGGNDTLTGGLGNDEYWVDSAADQLVEVAAGGVDTVHSSLSWTLAAPFENLVLVGVGAINAIGNASANQISGTAWANTLDGAQGADTMSGGGGNDTYLVDNIGDRVTELNGGGTDTVNSSVSFALGAEVENLILTGIAAISATGNILNNRLTGNASANVLNGGGGNDTLTGGAGNDTYVVDTQFDQTIETAGGGTDLVQSSITWTLAAEVENLQLTGLAALSGTGNALGNQLTGNGGANTLNGGLGADLMTGGAGNDTYWADNAGDKVVELASGGTDTVNSSVTWTLSNDVEHLALNGLAAINGSGNALANRLTGNAASNVLNGGGGSDTLIGGAGNDTYVVDNLGDLITELAGGGTDTVQAAVSWTLGVELENLQLTGTAANGTGNSLANRLTGNSLANVLNGGAGADTMTGGAGNDTYVVDNEADQVIEIAGGGIDTVQSNLTFSYLGAELENLVMNAAAGDGSATGNALNNQLTGNADGNWLNGLAGADTMTGGAGNDTYEVDNAGDSVMELAGGGTDSVEASISWTLQGQVEDLLLLGSAALNGTGNTLANHLTGNSGNNVLNGGAGNDTYTVNNIGDKTVEVAGGGVDTVESALSWTLATEVENLVLTGTAAVNGTGNASNNQLTGNSMANVLNGGLGADTLDGGWGGDTFIVDNVGDRTLEVGGGGEDLTLSSITWTLANEVERLTLTGTAAINGTGNALDNVLIGNAAANVLTGGLRFDNLIGGAGSDTFVLDDLLDWDNIADFTSGSDKLRISQSHLRVGDGDTLVEGAMSVSGPGGFSASAELVIITKDMAAGSFISLPAAAAAIGSASSAYATGRTVLFLVDNGSTSDLLYFKSADGNATVSASELSLLATLSGTGSTAVSDVIFGA